jgi:hypothetical protein
MRRALTFSLLLLVTGSGCGVGPSKNKGKLEGTSWGNEATKFQGYQVPAGYLKLIFKADGRMVYHVGTVTYAGNFEYGSGDIVIFKLDKELAGSKTHSEKIWFEGEKMMVSDTLGPKVGFRKLR